MIELRFSCKACGIHKHPVMVRERRQGEPLGEWFQDLYHLIGDAHLALSPRCGSGKVDLMIPAPNPGQNVGQRKRP